MWTESRVLQPPANALEEPVNTLSAVACPASGLCAGVGYGELGPTDNAQATAVLGEDDQWNQATALAPPHNAGPNAEAQLNGVACSPSGSCLAIGNFRSVLGGEDAMVASEASGSWAPAKEITAPPSPSSSHDRYAAGLQFIACQASGLCSALGQFRDDAGTPWLMAAGAKPVANATVLSRLRRSRSTPGVACRSHWCARGPSDARDV